MEKVKAVFVAIDTAIQRKFDAVIFFLMRTFGWRKVIIRYALWAVMITSIVGDLCLLWADKTLPISGMVALMSLFVGAYLIIQMRDYRDDHEAEVRGMRSRADMWSPAIVAIMKGCLYYFLMQRFGEIAAILVTTTFLDGGYAKLARELPKIVFELSYLSILYLARTPSEPPPREEKLKVLIPAREHSS